MKITSEEQLQELGFTRYERSIIHADNVKCFYQKRFDDEKGKKYYLDCLVWDWTWTDKVPMDTSFEFETQLYAAGTHEAIDLTFHENDVDKVIEFIEEMFTTGLVEHYELWN